MRSDVITVGDVVASMPDVPELWDRARALTLIAAIRDDAHTRYSMYPAGCCAGSGAVVHVPNEGYLSMGAHFHGERGTLVQAWHCDADVTINSLCLEPSPERRTDAEAVWDEFLLQVPAELRRCLWHGDEAPGEHSHPDCAEPGEMPWTSAVLWRRPGDRAWQTLDFGGLSEPWRDYFSAWVSEGDCADRVLGDLIAGPVQDLSLLRNGAEPTAAVAQAARRILANLPLTEETVRTLNPGRRLTDVADSAIAAGYRIDRRTA